MLLLFFFVFFLGGGGSLCAISQFICLCDITINMEITFLQTTDEIADHSKPLVETVTSHQFQHSSKSFVTVSFKYTNSLNKLFEMTQVYTCMLKTLIMWCAGRYKW